MYEGFLYGTGIRVIIGSLIEDKVEHMLRSWNEYFED